MAKDDKRIKISEKEAYERRNEICDECKHPLSYHIFWNQTQSILELMNCNECFCNFFESTNNEQRVEEKD